MEPDNAVDEEVRTGQKQGSPCKRMEPREPANTGGSNQNYHVAAQSVGSPFPALLYSLFPQNQQDRVGTCKKR